jgi:hypothetical protein
MKQHSGRVDNPSYACLGLRLGARPHSFDRFIKQRLRVLAVRRDRFLAEHRANFGGDRARNVCQSPETYNLPQFSSRISSQQLVH